MPHALPLLQRRRTKIVATVGPASRDPAVLEQLIRAGVNVFRLNMSHGEHADHQVAVQRIRELAEKLNEPVAILADLCGPKLRVGRFAGGQVELAAGSKVVVTTRDVPGGPGLVPSQYRALAADVRPGDRILLDDGLLELRVDGAEGTEIACTVVFGGVLKDRKGMNLPGVAVSAPALTEKDRADAAFALKQDVDFLALSFVRRPEEVADLKALVAAAGSTAQVVAKIEKPEALERIDAIVDAADAIMVARGDLGVELPPELVPVAQHQIVAKARARDKPVIIATQMLESMIEHPRPTRAEVSDVSHAVFSGADAVMLSAETAAGAYPVQAVLMMDRVARQVEAWQWAEGAFRSLAEPNGPEPLPVNLAVAQATSELSRTLRVRAIVVLSRGGTTATVISGARPGAPILAASPDPATRRRMNLLWGTVPVAVEPDELKNQAWIARYLARQTGLAGEGDRIIVVAGFRADETETQPLVGVLVA